MIKPAMQVPTNIAEMLTDGWMLTWVPARTAHLID
jgi:hypothetical protein